ncbi:response regulator [Paenibacillus agricola]|uniref:Response regulator n=1 Tax=Paenibacillus agricola TaxID=2716264 RepID=A0ABX0J697_9BACL|nr:response regulator [Paenibacillus agricola]NHN30358.1 response regulator [Paenibacillus agricola]
MLKILIVDDEITVLKGLNKILSKHCPDYEIVNMVQSPHEALRILTEKAVDVVITDVKMPDMDGIELTKRIRAQYPDTTVVVLSGHSDFEFVRQTLKNGAHDYLLKPCHYQTVVDLLRTLEDNVKHKEKKTLESNKKKVLEAVISGKQELSEEWAVYAHLQMIIIKIKDYKDPLLEEQLKKEFVNRNGDNEFLEMVTFDDIIVVLFQNSIDIATVRQRVFPNICKSGFRLCMAMHRFMNGPKCLQDAYNTCMQMIEFLEFNVLSIFMDMEMYLEFVERQKKYALNNYFSNQILLKHMMNGNLQMAQQYLSTNLNQLYLLDVYVDPVRIRKETLRELISLEQHLKDHGIDIEQHFGRQDDYLRELKELKTYRLLLNWFKKFVMGIIMKTEEGNYMPFYIHAAIKYINTHYMEDITLKMISEEVYVNPWYFSTQLKKHTGLSFSEYVNQARVRKAKEFLKQKDLKVYQVAEMVGFQDAAYFSTVFKSIEDITPKEYQKMI